MGRPSDLRLGINVSRVCVSEAEGISAALAREVAHAVPAEHYLALLGRRAIEFNSSSQLAQAIFAYGIQSKLEDETPSSGVFRIRGNFCRCGASLLCSSRCTPLQVGAFTTSRL